ncbi:FmdB family zinc ribbon protein [Myxosarcina sp. GI1(2024)]
MLTKNMPIYEFRCHDCGEFEALRSIAESNAPINCPQCSKAALKIFSVPNVNLNSGSLLSINNNSSEPKLVKREVKKPAKPRYQSAASSRPWMVSHAPPRY